MNKKKHPKVVAWAADWTSSTGQSIVTRRVFERQDNIDWTLVSYGLGGIHSLIKIFRAIAEVYIALIFKRNRIVYLVCSRSHLGFLRDVPALVASFLGVRVIVHVHGSDLDKLLLSSVWGPLVRLLYDRCEIVVPSEHLVDNLKQITKAPIFVCENFVPSNEIEKHVNFESEDASPVVVWNSNIMASKGFFDLCEAIRIVRASMPAIRLIALGEPIHDSEMSADSVRKALRSLQEEDWFTYIGSVSPDEAYSWTSLADLYVFPSRNECQPLALVQAMCLAKPIIANDIDALRATLGEYPARYLRMPNPKDLAFAISDIVNCEASPDLSIAALEAQKRFSPQRFDKTIASILCV